MIVPALKDDALIASIVEASATPHAFHLWWLGQSGFLLKWQKHFFLFDPYLSDSLTEKYRGTDKEHIRVSERCLDPARLGFVPWITSSHNHTDHLDAATLLPLLAERPDATLILSAANVAFAQERLAAHVPEFLPLTDGMSVNAGPFEVHGITAAHNFVDRNAAGHPLYIGFVVKFGPFAVYHSGDTLWHETLVSELFAHSPLDVVLVPINGNKPERRVAGNLNGTEAAALAKAVGARWAMPHHYDLFAFNTESPEEFIHTCQRLQQPCRVPLLGERVTIEHRDHA